MSLPPSTLSEEQRLRIDENRRRALAVRVLKQENVSPRSIPFQVATGRDTGSEAPTNLDLEPVIKLKIEIKRLNAVIRRNNGYLDAKDVALIAKDKRITELLSKLDQRDQHIEDLKRQVYEKDAQIENKDSWIMQLEGLKDEQEEDVSDADEMQSASKTSPASTSMGKPILSKVVKQGKTVQRLDLSPTTADSLQSYKSYKKRRASVKKCTCSHCDYNSRRKPGEENKDRHACDHTGCGKTYNNISDLRRHIEAKHSGTKFICPVCNIVLANQTSLRTHQLRHLNILPKGEKKIMQVLDRVTLIVSDDNKTAYLRESTKEDREATGELQVEQVYCIPVRSKETGEIVGYTGNYTNLFSVIHASSMINNNCDAAALREDIIWCEGCTYRLFGDADLELCWREAFPLQIFLLRRVMAEKVKGWIRIRLETFGNRTIIDAIKVLKEVDHHLEGRVQAAASLFNPETCDKILNKPRHQIFEGVPCVLRNIVIPITDLVKKF